MAIADSYDGFLIDLDGVVWLGHEPIEGSADALNALAADDKPVAFVTNSPRITPAEQARILQEHGIETDRNRVVTAGSTLLTLAREQVGEGAKIYVTGTSGFLSQVADAGFDALPADRWNEAAAVLITGHPQFDYSELKAASMAVRAGAFFAATGRDPTMPMPDGLWPGTGSILAAIETASGRTAIVAGKPERPIFDAGLEVLDLPAGSRVAMIGDRLDTDVGGAQNAGLDGILVTGNDSIPPGTEITPDYEISSLADIVA
ncbi:MAG: family hydrolase [Actinomycetota bacterium]|nr:family hydrolase [Actinomycetota bacterium]